MNCRAAVEIRSFFDRADNGNGPMAVFPAAVGDTERSRHTIRDMENVNVGKAIRRKRPSALKFYERRTD